MRTVDYVNKKTGTVYVYEVLENYWDKEKKQARSKRRLLGRRDPVTQEIIPTARKKKSADPDSPDYKSLYKTALKDIEKRDREISSLTQRIAFLEENLQKMEDIFKLIRH